MLLPMATHRQGFRQKRELVSLLRRAGFGAIAPEGLSEELKGMVNKKKVALLSAGESRRRIPSTAAIQEWLDRLLAPLVCTSGEPSLETLQEVEFAGQALIEQLPDGVLRRSAEQRLNTALQAESDQRAATRAMVQSIAALSDPCAATSRQRAGRRALRLFTHASECREMLNVLRVPGSWSPWME